MVFGEECEMNNHVVPNGVLKVRDEVVCKEIGDVCVILDLRSGAFYTLNETAGLFWKLIGEGITAEEICVRITQQYDISRDEALRDMAEFIGFFTKEQLLIR